MNAEIGCTIIYEAFFRQGTSVCLLVVYFGRSVPFDVFQVHALRDCDLHSSEFVQRKVSISSSSEKIVFCVSYVMDK